MFRDFASIKEPNDILKLSMEDYSVPLFNYLFGSMDSKGTHRFDPQKDIVTIKPGQYYNNKNEIKMPMGRVALNRAIIPEAIFNEIGFLDDRWSGGAVKKYHKKIAKLILDKKISVKPTVITFLDKLQFYSFGLNSTMSSSLTEKTVFIPDSIGKKTQELFKKYEKELSEGNTTITNKVSEELLAFAKKEIGDDVGMDLYESGSKASFGNNFKLLFLLKGSVFNPKLGKFETVTSNYMDGIDRKDYPNIADAMVKGAYDKGVGPAVGGYMVKKDTAAFQSIVLDKKGSFCKTKKQLEVELTPQFLDMFTLRYINDNGKLVLLDDETIKKYAGKTVKMYDSLCCTGDKLCNVCAGELYYKLGIKNVGLTFSKKSSILVNKCMKNFHDSNIKLHTIDPTDLVL